MYIHVCTVHALHIINLPSQTLVYKENILELEDRQIDAEDVDVYGLLVCESMYFLAESGDY